MRIAPQFVGHESSGNDQAVVISGLLVGDPSVRPARIAVFAGVVLLSGRARDRHPGSGFNQSQLGIPELQVFVDLVHEDQDTLIVERATIGGEPRCRGTAFIAFLLMFRAE